MWGEETKQSLNLYAMSCHIPPQHVPHHADNDNYGQQGRTQDFRRGGGGGVVVVARSAKEANKPNKRATELKLSVCFVESSIFMALV